MITFGYIANLASIGGFLFSLGALIQAWRASIAAEEALEVVLIRTLADEVEYACVKMDQLLDLLQHDRFPEAGMKAHELTSALSEIPHRRSPYLSDERKNILLDVRTQLQVMEQVISSHRREELRPNKRERLIKLCRDCSVILRENLGTIKGGLD